MVFAAAEGLLLVSVGGGEPHLGGSVGGDKDVPCEAVSFPLPIALDEAADGAVRAVYMVEPFDGIGLQQNLTIAGSQGAYSTEVFVVPDDEVAEKHDVVAGVHGGVGSVAVPEFPDGGGSVAHHVAPTGVGGVGGHL